MTCFFIGTWTAGGLLRGQGPLAMTWFFTTGFHYDGEKYLTNYSKMYYNVLSFDRGFISEATIDKFIFSL